VRAIHVPNGPTLYDPGADGHHHAACRRCGRVADLPASVDDAQALRAARAAGFAPDRAEVVVVGLCAACAGD
jgi:Fe2+ or Zn2+ uptake regulation protein